MWREATDFEDSHWPPRWLTVVACVLVIALGIFVALGLSHLIVAFVTRVTTWLTWLSRTDLVGVVLDPVRKYLNGHAQGVRLPPDSLWTVWSLSGTTLLFLAFRGSIGARVGWTIFGVGTCAMVWAETSQPSEWLATGIAALWWSALSVVAYKRLPVRFRGRGERGSRRSSEELRRFDRERVSHGRARALGYTGLEHYFDERGNKTIPVIAKDLHVPLSRVSELRGEYLSEETSIRSQLNPRQQREILKDYRSGNHDLAEIARRHDVSIDIVRRHVNKHQKRQS